MKLLGKDTPTYIVNWIMESCESEATVASVGLTVGKGCTFNHALKMRAAASWGFAYKLGIGGNPASTKVTPPSLMRWGGI